MSTAKNVFFCNRYNNPPKLNFCKFTCLLLIVLLFSGCNSGGSSSPESNTESSEREQLDTAEEETNQQNQSDGGGGINNTAATNEAHDTQESTDQEQFEIGDEPEETSDITLPVLDDSISDNNDEGSSDVIDADDSSNEDQTGTSPPVDEPQTFPVAAGLFCSCGPTNEKASSVPADAEEMAFLDGVLVRIHWRELAPEPGVYDWQLLDEQIAIAEAAGTKISFSAINGGESPPWLAEVGAETIDFEFRGSLRTMALPWDPVYLTYLTDFISALGARYDDNETIYLIHMTNATTNGFEMQYNFDASAEAEFFARGYTEQRLIDSWITIMEAYHQAFPKTLIDVEVHPVFGSNTVAQQVVAYGHENFGQHFGVFAAWWDIHNAENVYEAMFSLLLEAQAQSFATVQIVGSASSDKATQTLTPEELFATLDYAIDAGIVYLEVWNDDLENEDFTDDLTEKQNAIYAETQ